MASIYKITNIVTGHIYVGKTSYDPVSRFKTHIKNAFSRNKDTYLYRAFRKYGIPNFKCEEIHKVIETEDINVLEIHFIKILSPEYNMTAGGDGGATTTGYKWYSNDVNSILVSPTDHIPEGYSRGYKSSKFNNPEFQREMSARVDRSKIDYKKIGRKISEAKIEAVYLTPSKPKATEEEILKHRKIQCLHCGVKIVWLSTYLRLHGDNCKKKEIHDN